MKKLFTLNILIATLLLLSCSSSDDIATINGKKITRQQFDEYLQFKRIQVRNDEHRNALIDQFLEREALSQVIKDQKKFNKAAAQAELDEFERQMNISRYFEKYLSDAVTEEKIKNYYVTNEAQYVQEKVHVAHVLFRLTKGMTEEERKVKLTQANEAYSKLKADVAFEKIVDDYSEDRISAKKQGDLGWLKKGAIDAKFSDKIFSMKKDELSEPFETSFGFHIVTIKKPYEAVKGDIRYQLRQLARDAELKALKSKIKISRKQ